MKNIETKTLIEVEGAILTSRALDKLKFLQEENNHWLNDGRDGLSDVVCWLAIGLEELSDDRAQEARAYMCFLSHLRNDIDCLRKP